MKGKRGVPMVYDIFRRPLSWPHWKGMNRKSSRARLQWNLSWSRWRPRFFCWLGFWVLFDFLFVCDEQIGRAKELKVDISGLVLFFPFLYPSKNNVASRTYHISSPWKKTTNKLILRDHNVGVSGGFTRHTSMVRLASASGPSNLQPKKTIERSCVMLCKATPSKIEFILYHFIILISEIEKFWSPPYVWWGAIEMCIYIYIISICTLFAGRDESCSILQYRRRAACPPGCHRNCRPMASGDKSPVHFSHLAIL